jgi:hypothetical protein
MMRVTTVLSNCRAGGAVWHTLGTKGLKRPNEHMISEENRNPPRNTNEQQPDEETHLVAD